MNHPLALDHLFKRLSDRPVRTGVARPSLLSKSAGLAGCLILCGYVPAGCADQFTPPDLQGFAQESERQADGDGDGVKETHIVHYLNEQGDSIVSMTTKGQLWAWSLETRDDPSSTRNYVIRDSNCDGVFDEVYGLDEEFHVPDCLK